MMGVDPEWVDQIPGRLSERRSPLGELHWIFTAIMDAIAWNILPSQLFQKLFRQDLLVASLFRNFLLADRIFRFDGGLGWRVYVSGGRVAGGGGGREEVVHQEEEFFVVFI